MMIYGGTATASPDSVPVPGPAVSDITPYYWRPGAREPSAPYYFYLLFDKVGDPQVELNALRAVICDLASPVALPGTLPDHQAPLLIPVKQGFNEGVIDTDAALRGFRSNGYDADRAGRVIRALGLSDRNVYLIASQKRLDDFANGIPRVADFKFRAVYIDHTDPYERVAMQSIIDESYEGSLFNGRSSRDFGYIAVSFTYKLGMVVADIVPKANAAPAADSREICE
jgi:hypothetical protein